MKKAELLIAAAEALGAVQSAYIWEYGSYEDQAIRDLIYELYDKTDNLEGKS